jgi:epoxyqueuosine reductase
MITKEEIRHKANQLGLTAVGFTHPGPFERAKAVLEQRKKQGYLSGFEVGYCDRRCNPQLHMDDIKSIISVGLPYRIPVSTPKPGHLGLKGTISGSAVGPDYHRELNSKLEVLSQWIASRVDGFKYRIMVDTGPLIDREIAFRSGIGWFGKNCSIICPECGSGIFLGEILTNVELEPDRPINRYCGDCNLCIDICPTGALAEPYTINALKCISYLTQMRGVIPKNHREAMGTSIFGCDRCQQCCPHNSRLYDDGDGRNIIDLREIIQMDKNRFKQEYGDSAIGWRGLNLLKRNAAVAIGNIGSEQGFELLEQALNNPSALVRGHAAWAVGRIGRPKSRHILKRAVAFEKDPYVLGEIKDAIDMSLM